MRRSPAANALRRKVAPHPPGTTGQVRVTANTVSRGGGGVQFEHRVGADMLNRLLTRSGLEALDDAFEITEVAFQTSDPVDDLRVRAHSVIGSRRCTWPHAGSRGYGPAMRSLSLSSPRCSTRSIQTPRASPRETAAWGWR